LSEAYREEEELRLELEELGREHDCLEAGCELDPEGRRIPDEAGGRRRRKLSDKGKKLWKKHRGYEWPG